MTLTTFDQNRLQRQPTFDRVIGQQAAKRLLRNWIASSTRQGGVILHGPSGAGKAMLARACVEVLLCEAGAPGGQPCQTCSTCFELMMQRQPFGDICIDARLLSPSSGFINVTDNPSFDNLHAITIDHVDHIDRVIFDPFLKTLEEAGSAYVFIFLAEDIEKIPDTIRSRCLEVRIGPSLPDDATEICATLLETQEVTCCSELPAILAKFCGFLPGRIATAVQKFPRGSFLSQDVLDACFGTKETLSAIEYWSLLFRRQADAGRLHERTSISAMREVLCGLRPGANLFDGSCVMFRSAPDEMKACSSALAQAAAIKGGTALKLWSEIACLWLADEFAREAGFRLTVASTRMVLRA